MLSHNQTNMEVVIPVNPTDHFDFNASAYANAPSTPRFMGDYFSAPNSPTRIQDLEISQFDELLISESDNPHPVTYSLATVPFAWEEKPGVPKSFFDHQDFAFNVTGDQFNRNSAADDLFQGGVIKPIEFQQVDRPEQQQQVVVDKNKLERERGRERTTSSLSSSRSSRRTRSLPPFRGSEQQQQQPPPAPVTTTLSVFGSKKWSFRDLFLFRSASDGRAMDKDPLKKYSSIFRKHDEDFRNSMSRDRSGSGSGSRRRGPRVSAHELHYTVNRAVSNDMKKKTFLPYKQGILGRLAFNPTVHALSNGFGNFHNMD